MIDGGSTDGTVGLLRGAEARYPHLRWISEPDNGISDALNKGLQLASGDLVGVIGDDDSYEANAFETVAQAAATAPNAGIMAGHCRLIRNDGFVVGVARASYTNRKDLLECWSYWGNRVFIPAPASFISRAALAKVGGFEERDRYAMDYRHWIKLTEHFQVCVVDHVLANFRQDEGSISFSLVEKQWKETIAISKDYWGSFLSWGFYRFLTSYWRFQLGKEVTMLRLRLPRTYLRRRLRRLLSEHYP